MVDQAGDLGAAAVVERAIGPTDKFSNSCFEDEVTVLAVTFDKKKAVP
ncbi:MAG TPA: hypothetical protein VFR05_00165 [Terriglobia bacterium]|nr:hypothetical protein [Terriglobia bacterium]